MAWFWEHGVEVDIADSVVALKFSPRRPSGEIFGFQMFKIKKILIRLSVRLRRQTAGVVNSVRPLQPVNNTHRLLC